MGNKSRQPANLNTNGNKIAISRREVSVHHGPLPDPDTLARYESIEPGIAGRIIVMAEKEQNNRLECERVYLNESLKVQKLGAVFAFFIGVSAIGAGTVASIYGNPIGGTLLSLSGIASLVGAFLKGTRVNNGK